MLPDPVLELFRLQHGLAADHQIRDVEPDRSRRRRIHRCPDVERASPRVLRHRAAPRTRAQELSLAVLDAGRDAVLWGKSAATHWGFGRFRAFPAHVAVPRGRTHQDHIAQVHSVRAHDLLVPALHDDVLVARPEVVIFWLAGMWTHRLGHEVALERTAIALDQAWRQRLVDGRCLHDLAATAGGFGRSGIVVLRQALETRPPGYQPAGSRLEERFEELLPPHIRSLLRRQVTVDVDPVRRTVDYRVADRPLIVEVNGEVFHTSRTDRAADEARYRRLLELGFSVVVFWEYDIWHDGRAVREAMARLVGDPHPHPTLHRPTRAPWETR